MQGKSVEFSGWGRGGRGSQGRSRQGWEPRERLGDGEEGVGASEGEEQVGCNGCLVSTFSEDKRGCLNPWPQGVHVEIPCVGDTEAGNRLLPTPQFTRDMGSLDP